MQVWNPKMQVWNPKMQVWNMIILFKQVIFRFQPLIFEGVTYKYACCVFFLSGNGPDGLSIYGFANQKAHKNAEKCNNSL